MPELPQVCPFTVPSKWGGYLWPCVRAAGHEPPCTPPSEAGHYPRPLEERDPAWVLSELKLWIDKDAGARRDHREQLAHERARLEGVGQFLRYVAEAGAGRSGKHDDTCWLRHPACLARLALYHPGDIDGRIDRAHTHTGIAPQCGACAGVGRLAGAATDPVVCPACRGKDAA